MASGGGSSGTEDDNAGRLKRRKGDREWFAVATFARPGVSQIPTRLGYMATNSIILGELSSIKEGEVGERKTTRGVL